MQVNINIHMLPEAARTSSSCLLHRPVPSFKFWRESFISIQSDDNSLGSTSPRCEEDTLRMPSKELTPLSFCYRSEKLNRALHAYRHRIFPGNSCRSADLHVDSVKYLE